MLIETQIEVYLQHNLAYQNNPLLLYDQEIVSNLMGDVSEEVYDHIFLSSAQP